MTKEEKIAAFDPNGIGVDNGHFIGLPFEESESDLVIVSVPWDVTASYGVGTSTAPQNILTESRQLDLYDADYPEAWKRGIFLRPSPENWFEFARVNRQEAETYLAELEAGKKVEENPDLQRIGSELNRAGEKINLEVRSASSSLLSSGKKVGVLGGDHSVPLGFIQALADVHDSFGILQIDAHQDLRKAYEGFTFSHASIFRNAMELPQISKLVQVGIRDHCEEEVQFAKSQGHRVSTHTMSMIRRNQFRGGTWSHYISMIIKELPQKVYISFDIDGLEEQFCPNTGTPVPGGLHLEEVRFLIKRLADSGRQIIGFDLCEVAGDEHEWDGNVGARVLYMLSCAILSQK